MINLRPFGKRIEINRWRDDEIQTKKNAISTDHLEILRDPMKMHRKHHSLKFIEVPSFPLKKKKLCIPGCLYSIVRFTHIKYTYFHFS